MVYIALVLSLWLLFVAVAVETNNRRPKLLIEIPCYMFSFIVGLWFCKQVGII